MKPHEKLHFDVIMALSKWDGKRKHFIIANVPNLTRGNLETINDICTRIDRKGIYKDKFPVLDAGVALVLLKYGIN